MSANKRRTLAIKIETPGGDNPLTMRLVGRGPFFRGIAVANLALVGQGGSPPYAFSIVSGGDSNGGLNGLTLNTDGTFSGVPDDAGRFVFVATVSDSASQTYTHSFSLTFLSQLILVAGTPTPGAIGLAYSYQFVVRDLSGVTVTSGYTLHSGNLPAGLSINTNGLLSGTPTVPAGISYFVIRLTAGSDFLDIACRMEVVTPVQITFGQRFLFIAGTDGTTYQIEATGGLPPYRFRYFDPTDPFINGLSLSPQGVVSGTALGKNFQARDIIVIDALGGTDDAFVTIESRDPNPIIQPRKNSGDVGDPGPSTLNFIEGAGIEIDVANNGTDLDVTISTTGTPGSGGISTVNGVGPDSSGNLGIGGVVVDSNGDLIVDFPAGSGITSFASHDLSPLFTQSVTNPTGPAVDLAFSQIAQAINLVFAGPASGGSANPTFRALVTNDLPNTAVTPGTYGSATSVPVIVVDAKGRITSAASTTISDSGALLLFPDGNLSSGFGTINLTREAFYNNVTFGASDTINLNGFSLNINNADMTAAGAGAIKWDANAGGNGAIGTGTPAGTGATGGSAAGMCGNGFAGSVGASGNSNNGTAGTPGTQATPTFNGGLTGASGAGGASPTRTGGASTAAPGAGGNYQPMGRVAPYLQVINNAVNPATIKGGNGGSGGGSGGGSSVTGGAGGSGGGGGAGGNVVQVRINTLTRGSGTAAGAIRAIGGNGGTGGQGSAAGDIGGGGGGSGGGGGWLYLVVRTLAGSTATNMLSAAGGAGGAGGNRVNGGTAGSGGNGGTGGRISYLYLDGNSGTEITGSAGGSGTAGSGGTPGTGGAGGVCSMSV